MAGRDTVSIALQLHSEFYTGLNLHHLRLQRGGIDPFVVTCTVCVN